LNPSPKGAMTRPFGGMRAVSLVAAALALVACAAGPVLRADTAAEPQRRFGTPEEAVKALAAATKAGDRAAVDAIFGPEVKDLLSGDPKQDEIEFAAFAKSIGQHHHLVHTSQDKCIVNIGAQNWPLPIPLVRRDGAWFFDTAAGKDEVVSRRVGEDELTAIGVCRTYVLAQREYQAEDRDGSGLLKYAQRLKSTPGAKDGLFWAAAPGEEESPLGPLVAEARAEGYGPKTDEGKPQPFHGYRFKILAAQGASAPGGAYSYVINGNMVAGFALVAYPAHWGESGVMTFIVSQSGKVYERNLGEDSADVGAAMTDFDPDSDWTPVSPP
jgi:Protein of unknown function (DUF2950)